MQKSKTEIECTVKGYPLHGLTEAAHYCPLVWMFHSLGKNNKLNRLQERCLRIIYSDKKSASIELLDI